MAVIGALIVENALDDFLSAWLIDYKPLRDKKDFTFSLKVELAISLKLIPKKILNAIEPVRQIRNIFAHHLDIDTFKQAKELKPDHFKKMYNKIKTFTKWPFDDDFITFKELCFYIAFALNIYSKHLTVVRDYIWTEKNLNKIVKSNENKLIKEIQSML